MPLRKPNPRDAERFQGLEGEDSLELVMHLHRYEAACQFAAGQRVLDFGSGDGYGARLLAESARAVTALDNDPLAVEAARGKYQAYNLRYEVGGIASLAEMPEAQFGLVTCFEVIEHMDEASQGLLVESLSRLVQPGGLLIASTPNAEVKKRHYERFPNWRNPYHVRELNRSEFEALLHRSFEHVAVIPQVAEATSVMGFERTAGPRVSAETAWVHVGLASRSPLSIPERLPPVCLPRKRAMLEELLLNESKLSEGLRWASEELSRGKAAMAGLQAELSKTKREFQRLRAQVQSAQEQVELLREKVTHPMRVLKQGAETRIRSLFGCLRK